MPSDMFDRMATVRADIDKVRHDLAKMCEPSRELSLAITKLDEARLWAFEALSVPHYAATNGDSP